MFCGAHAPFAIPAGPRYALASASRGGLTSAERWVNIGNSLGCGGTDFGFEIQGAV